MPGIPVDELLEWNKKLRRMEEAAIDIAPRLTDNPEPNSVVNFDDLDFIKGMEREFVMQADGLLDRMGMAHLRVAPQK